MSINKAILVGNVGADPEVRYPQKGQTVAQFRLATNERGRLNDDGTRNPDITDWHNIVLWGRNAEIAERYIRKGSQLYVEGKIRTRSYQDKTGITRYITEIYGDRIELLSRRPDDTPAQ